MNTILEINKIWQPLLLSDSSSAFEIKTDEPVIMFVLQGDIQLYINNILKREIFYNEMAVLPSGCLYHFFIRKTTRIIICQFPLEILIAECNKIDKLLSLSMIQNDDEIKKMHLNKTIIRFLLLLCNNIEDKIVSERFFDIKRNELLILLFAYYSEKEIAGFFSEFLSKNINFKKFVFDNHCKAKNMAELASLSNSSQSGFIKKFRSTFDESPYRWMQKQKAKLILNDMNKGQKSLQEIAIEYNFSSYQHFAKFCHRFFKMSPTAICGKSHYKKS